MTDEVKIEEVSPEQKAVNDEVEKLKNRLMEIAIGLYNEGYKVYALDSAADIFKSCMKIQLGKSKQWTEYLEKRQDVEEALYNCNSNELTYEEAPTEELKDEADTVAIS